MKRGGTAERRAERHALIGGDSDLLLMACASGAVATQQAAGLLSWDPGRHELTVIRLKPPRDLYFSAPLLAKELEAALTEARMLVSAERRAGKGAPSAEQLENGDRGHGRIGRIRRPPSSSQGHAAARAARRELEAAEGPEAAEGAAEGLEPLSGGSGFASGGVAVHEAALDLVLCLVLAAGNDYLPALRGAGTSDDVWANYLATVSAGESTDGEAAVLPLVATSGRRGAGAAQGFALSRRGLAALLVRCLGRSEDVEGRPNPKLVPTDRDRRAAPAYLRALEWNLEM